MREYRFVTTWCVDAPIERVFDAIDDAARWPQWWNGVTRAELLEPGAEDGVGRLWRYSWRSALPYELTFDSRVTRREPVVCEWNVRTSRAWMNWLAPVARPAFGWNHDVIMRQGAEGLARLLNAPLLVRS
jgi:hypothetical protein